MMTDIEQQPELKTEIEHRDGSRCAADLGCEHRFVWFERCDHSQYRSFIQRGSA